MKYGFATTEEIENSEDISAKDIWIGFKEGTTAHGIPQVGNARGWIKRGLWILISMGVCTILAYHMYSIITEYRQYNTSIQMAILQQYKMAFPAVTICNLNAVKRSKIENDTSLQHLLDSGNSRRRRKRSSYAASDPTCQAGLWYPKYGLCILPREATIGRSSAITMCGVDFAKLFMPVSAEIHQYVSQTYIGENHAFNSDRDPKATILNITSVYSLTSFWINLVGGLWGGYVAATWTNWNSSFKDPLLSGAVSSSLDGNLWHSANVSSEHSYLCQVMIECPNTVYTDPDKNTTVCWFAPLGSVYTTWPNALAFCKNYHLNATLMELNTEARHSFFVSTVYPQISKYTGSSSNYWLGLQSQQWISNEPLTWTNWASAPLGSYAYGEPIGHNWTTTDHLQKKAFIICEAEGLPNGTYVEETTTQSETTTETTTERETVAAQTTSVTTTTTQSPLLFGNKVSEEFKQEQYVIESIVSLPEEQKRTIGYQSSDMILDCSFQGWTCSDTLFYQYNHPMYGNCYMFNSGWNDSVEVEVSHRTGRRFGFKTTLNIGEDEYLTRIGGPAGLRVVIHPQRKMPHPEQEGQLLEPGKLISIGVKKTAIERQPDPYGICQQNITDVLHDVFAEMFPVNYSRPNCFHTCYQRHVITDCDCADAYYPTQGLAFGNKTIAICSIYNYDQEFCKLTVQDRFTRGQLDCSEKCPEACYEEFFFSSPSTAVWPSSSHKDLILEKLKDKIPASYLVNGSTKYQRNLLQLEVFFEDFNYEKIQEIPAYELVRLASDIGGMLGLWVGCSAISICQFIELGLDMFVLALLKSCCKRKRNNTKPEFIVSAPPLSTKQFAN